MIDHAGLNVSDYQKSKAFYLAALAPLGYQVVMELPDSILPQGADGARRITYRRLATMADESNLDYDRRTIQIKHERDSLLDHVDMTMVLEGDYRDVRRFIHKIETAPEFVVIQDISLVQGEKNKPLTLTLQLSTYYKAGS